MDTLNTTLLSQLRNIARDIHTEMDVLRSSAVHWYEESQELLHDSRERLALLLLSLDDRELIPSRKDSVDNPKRQRETSFTAEEEVHHALNTRTFATEQPYDASVVAACGVTEEAPEAPVQPSENDRLLPDRPPVESSADRIDSTVAQTRKPEPPQNRLGMHRRKKVQQQQLPALRRSPLNPEGNDERNTEKHHKGLFSLDEYVQSLRPGSNSPGRLVPDIPAEGAVELRMDGAQIQSLPQQTTSTQQPDAAYPTARQKMFFVGMRSAPSRQRVPCRPSTTTYGTTNNIPPLTVHAWALPSTLAKPALQKLQDENDVNRHLQEQRVADRPENLPIGAREAPGEARAGAAPPQRLPMNNSPRRFVLPVAGVQVHLLGGSKVASHGLSPPAEEPALVSLPATSRSQKHDAPTFTIRNGGEHAAPHCPPLSSRGSQSGTIETTTAPLGKRRFLRIKKGSTVHDQQLAVDGHHKNGLSVAGQQAAAALSPEGQQHIADS